MYTPKIKDYEKFLTEYINTIQMEFDTIIPKVFKNFLELSNFDDDNLKALKDKKVGQVVAMDKVECADKPFYEFWFKHNLTKVADELKETIFYAMFLIKDKYFYKVSKKHPIYSDIKSNLPLAYLFFENGNLDTQIKYVSDEKYNNVNNNKLLHYQKLFIQDDNKQVWYIAEAIKELLMFKKQQFEGWNEDVEDDEMFKTSKTFNKPVMPPVDKTDYGFTDYSFIYLLAYITIGVLNAGDYFARAEIKESLLKEDAPKPKTTNFYLNADFMSDVKNVEKLKDGKVSYRLKDKDYNIPLNEFFSTDGNKKDIDLEIFKEKVIFYFKGLNINTFQLGVNNIFVKDVSLIKDGDYLKNEERLFIFEDSEKNADRINGFIYLQQEPTPPQPPTPNPPTPIPDPNPNPYIDQYLRLNNAKVETLILMRVLEPSIDNLLFEDWGLRPELENYNREMDLAYYRLLSILPIYAPKLFRRDIIIEKDLEQSNENETIYKFKKFFNDTDNDNMEYENYISIAKDLYVKSNFKLRTLNNVVAPYIIDRIGDKFLRPNDVKIKDNRYSIKTTNASDILDDEYLLTIEIGINQRQQLYTEKGEYLQRNDLICPLIPVEIQRLMPIYFKSELERVVDPKMSQVDREEFFKYVLNYQREHINKVQTKIIRKFKRELV